MKGAAYIGLLEQLDLSACDVYVGISVGAVFGLACALGYSSAELTTFTKGHHMAFNGMTTKKITQLHLLDRGALLTYVTDLLKEKGFSTKLTFAHLKQYLGKTLHVVVTPLLEEPGALTAVGDVHVFSPATAPDVPVCAAILASTSFPLIFPPMRIDGRQYLDGALSCGLGGCIDLLRAAHPDIPDADVLAVQLCGQMIDIRHSIGLGYAGQLLDLLMRLLKRNDAKWAGPCLELDTSCSATTVPALWAGWLKIIQIGRDATLPSVE